METKEDQAQQVQPPLRERLRQRLQSVERDREQMMAQVNVLIGQAAEIKNLLKELAAENVHQAVNSMRPPRVTIMTNGEARDGGSGTNGEVQS